MRKVALAFLAAAIGIIGTASVASACDVTGKVVCTGTTIPADDVNVVLTGVLNGSEGTVYSDLTDQNGIFFMHVGGGNFLVNLDPNLTLVCTGPTIDLTATPFEADGPNCPPVNQCTPTVPEGVTFPFCPARPIGNPKAECEFFGLVVVDKTDVSNGGLSLLASTTAPLALVKAGGCYSMFQNVVKDQTLLTAPFTQGISHVTYCTCP